MTDYTKEKNIELPMEEVNKLLGHGDGNAALLYLHVRRAGTFSLGRAARELKCTEAELLAAAGTLRALGLLDAPEPAEITPSEAPQYTAEDVAARARTDSAFEAVVAEAARIGYIQESDIQILNQWRRDPANWGKEK